MAKEMAMVRLVTRLVNGAVRVGQVFQVGQPVDAGRSWLPQKRGRVILLPDVFLEQVAVFGINRIPDGYLCFERGED